MTATPHTMPVQQSAACDLEDADAVPRVLEWALVKRIDPRLPNTWGHWWIELDGEESYGWWPTPCPLGWMGAMLGSRGCLNGMGAGPEGTATRDAYHGDEPDHWFHPTLVVAKSDEQLRRDIRTFARSHSGGFCWQWWWLRGPAQNCRTFQDQMFEAVGLAEEPEYLYTRGTGCPFMFPFRKVRWRTQDGLAAVIGRLREWSPASNRWAARRRAVVRAGRPPHTASEPLTDPKSRARARIRGHVSPGRRSPLEDERT